MCRVKNGVKEIWGSVLKRRRTDKVNRIDASSVVAREKCEVIIDGYNLMHVTRFKPISQKEGELQRCREGLLTLLAKHALPRWKTIVVFDSENAPKHLPDKFNWQHIRVLFARDENSADDLIASLIQKHANAKQLVVVSSDHRVQVAASRRKATAIDSETWFDALLDLPRKKMDSDPTSKSEPARIEPELSAEELDEFRIAMNEPIDVDGAKDTTEESIEFENPFPDGYFDDLDGLA